VFGAQICCIPLARRHSSARRRQERSADALQKLRLNAAIVGAGRPARGKEIARARRLAALHVGIHRAGACVNKRHHLNARVAILKVGSGTVAESLDEKVGRVANEPARGNVVARRANQQAGERDRRDNDGTASGSNINGAR
jgi:hypothetical protein